MTKRKGSDVAGGLAVALISRRLREGKVITFPSIGVILSSVQLCDLIGAHSTSREGVLGALRNCLSIQQRELGKVSAEEQRETIQENIARIQPHIANLGRFLL